MTVGGLQQHLYRLRPHTPQVQAGKPGGSIQINADIGTMTPRSGRRRFLGRHLPSYCGTVLTQTALVFAVGSAFGVTMLLRCAEFVEIAPG